jgi:signal transduction histidine kinase
VVSKQLSMRMSDVKSWSPWLISAFLAGLVLALGGLVVAFVVSFGLADRQYRLATMSERQAGTVSQIAELANSKYGDVALDRMLARYRALIAEESALAPDDPVFAAHQHRETEEAERLTRLARTPADADAFRVLTAQIAQQEVGEVAASRQKLERLHGRTVALAVALAVAALLCALSAAWLLARRNRSLEALVQARTVQLEEVDRSRRLFFAKASHELRTPVTAMRGEAEVALLDPEASSQVLRQSLSHIRANAAFLGHRIDELLGLASADDGQLQLERSPLELGWVVADAVAEARSFARSVEVTIVQTGLDEPIHVHGDARWLRQALLAAIDNGLKFSPMGGELVIDITVRDREAVLTVSDNGPGAMPGDLPRIFDAYYQSESVRQRGGNGLGLALARWVVEQHGGTIHAANRPQGGCQITIALPVETGA